MAHQLHSREIATFAKPETDCWTWTDELGVNYLFRTLSEPAIDLLKEPDYF